MRAIVAVGNHLHRIPPSVQVIKVTLLSDRRAIVNGTPPDDKVEIPAEWVIAPSAASRDINNDPVILYLHGYVANAVLDSFRCHAPILTLKLPYGSGGYFLSNAEGHRSLTWQLSQTAGLPILSVSYRLAPEATFPSQLQDAISSYLFLRSQNPSRPIVLAGDSAGGGLVTALALWIRDQSHDIPQADGIVAFAPWLDLTHSYPSFENNSKYDYLPASTEDPSHVIHKKRTHYYTISDDQLRDPLVSPVFAQDRLDKPLPPMLIHIGEKERLRDESLAFGAFQTSSAIRVESFQDMPHVFQVCL